MTAVKPGQVWQDCDKRAYGRTVRVVDVDATHATVELVAQRGRPARGHEDAQRAEPGRRTRIRLDRFKPTSTGYRLVQDTERRAADLPQGSVVATTRHVWIKEDASSINPWAGYCETVRALSDDYIDDRLADGAEVLRVGSGTEETP
jgi:hypothetical protein